MRAFAVLVGIVVAGCSSTTEGTAPVTPNACADAFVGSWKLVLAQPRAVAGGAPLCEGFTAGKRIEADVFVDGSMTTWTETDAIETVNYTLTPYTTGATCDGIGATRSAVEGERTRVAAHSLIAADGALSGLTLAQVFATAELDANGSNAEPLCEVVFTTRATR